MEQRVHPRLGALKDPVDVRDFQLRKVIKPVDLPRFVDYEHDMGPVKDQGLRGACVAFAAIAVKEYQERKQRKGRPQYDLSEEFVYRQIMHPGGGAYPRDAFKAFMSSGVPRDKYMPYDPNLSDEEKLPFTPSSAALRNAKYYLAGGFARLNTIDEMKQSLAINGPFSIGITWWTNWFDPTEKIGRDYVITSAGGSDAGGHAMAVVGYDDDKGFFKVRNSWGKTWANDGYIYISYDVIAGDMNDAWASLDMTSNNVKLDVVNKLKEKVNA